MLWPAVMYAAGLGLVAIESARPTIVVGVVGALLIVAAAAWAFVVRGPAVAGAGLGAALVVVPLLYLRRRGA